MKAKSTSDTEVVVGSRGPLPSAFPAGQAGGWSRHLWENRALAGLQFPCAEGLDALIREFWEDPALEGLPRVYVGHHTVIVPAVIVDYLRQKGHQFTTVPAISSGDLSAEEVNEIRRHG